LGAAVASGTTREMSRGAWKGPWCDSWARRGKANRCAVAGGRHQPTRTSRRGVS
jgi:hypothetical protein